MRFILRQFAEEPEDGRGKCIFYVDLLDKATKLAKLKSVFPGMSPTMCHGSSPSKALLPLSQPNVWKSWVITSLPPRPWSSLTATVLLRLQRAAQIS